MRKSLRVLLLSLFFVFVLSGVVFAEEYSIKNNGNPTMPVKYPYTSKTISAFSVKMEGVNGIEVKYYRNDGTSGGMDIPKSRSGSSNMCGLNVTGIQLKFWETKYPILSPDANAALIEVVFCDGTTVNFDDPFSPPPPDPPDDGGNTPPAGGNLPPGTDWGAVDPSKPANACGQPRWTSPIRNWIDDIFCPVIAFLDLARSKLAAVSLMMGQGLNIGQYFRIFGDLPLSWQLVVSSLLLMVATLGGLLIFRSAMRIYYSIKEGVKWW